MTTIRVDPSEMARVAQELADASGKLRAKAEDVASEAAGAPEHDGQFGPQVREMAFEAQNPLLAQAVRLDELSDELATLSQAFAEADAQSREGLTGLMLSLSKLFAKLGLAPASPEYLSATDRVFTQLTPTPKPQVAHGSAIAAQTLSSGSSKLTSGMPTEPIYAGGMSEAELASLQQFQGPRNDCAEYSVAAGLNVIYAGRVRGRDVATLADLGSFGYYRTFPNGPTSPAQAARIVNDIAGRGGLALTASSGKSTPEELVDT